MSSHFNFSRLLQLIRKQWIENSKQYIYSILALLGFMALVFTFWIYSSGGNYSEDEVYIIFLFGIFLTGTIFSSVSFSMLGDKAKATYWLSIPASHLEKLLCMIFYSVIVFALVYCACFFLVKTIAVAYIEKLVAQDPATYSYKLILVPRGFWTMFTTLIYVYFAAQAFYFLGSVYFARSSYILTTIAGAVISFVLIYYLSTLVRYYFNGPDYLWGGERVEVYQGNGNGNPGYRYTLPPFLSDLVEYGLKFIWAPVFWLVAWYRLKEKQV